MSLDAGMGLSPRALIEEIDARATRYKTPSGQGAMVWRAWGPESGPPLLLLHGAHGSWTHWIRNVERLSALRRVFAPDMPGYGDSAMPVESEEVTAFTDPLAAGLRELVGEPIDLAGFSTGAVIGANLARLNPDVVRRLIIIDAGGLDTPMVHPEMTRLRGLEGEARIAAHRANLLQIMIHDPANIDALALYLQEFNGPRARAKAHVFVLPDGLIKILPEIGVQMDTIWGAHDRPHPDPALQNSVIQRFDPGAELRVVQNAGHWSMFENAPGFNAALLDLLDRPLRAR